MRNPTNQIERNLSKIEKINEWIKKLNKLKAVSCGHIHETVRKKINYKREEVRKKVVDCEYQYNMICAHGGAYRPEKDLKSMLSQISNYNEGTYYLLQIAERIHNISIGFDRIINEIYQHDAEIIANRIDRFLDETAINMHTWIHLDGIVLLMQQTFDVYGYEVAGSMNRGYSNLRKRADAPEYSTPQLDTEFLLAYNKLQDRLGEIAIDTRDQAVELLEKEKTKILGQSSVLQSQIQEKVSLV